MAIIKITEEVVAIVEVGIQGPEGPGTAYAIESKPSSGQYKILNMRLDADKKIIVTYDDTPEP